MNKGNIRKYNIPRSSRRPIVRWVDDVKRGIIWQENTNVEMKIWLLWLDIARKMEEAQYWTSFARVASWPLEEPASKVG